LNPRTWVPKASVLTPRPPKPPAAKVKMRNISDRSCRKNQSAHIMFDNFFPKVVMFLR
jgi:hypothetical protein